VIPYMQRHRWGRFITITSISVKQPIADLVLSNSVRAAVVGLVKSLSNEFGKDGILVNNVAPGYTATERLQELAQVRALAAGTGQQQIYDSWAAETPVKRLGDPKEIADVIVWLASERASYVTGQTILADGGIYRGLKPAAPFPQQNCSCSKSGCWVLILASEGLWKCILLGEWPSYL